MSTIKRPTFKSHYDNYIGGKFVAPVQGKYFDNISPLDGKVFTKAAHSTKEDLDLAVDAAAKAFETWSKTSATERSIILNKIADRMEENLEYIAAVETVDNGKAVRETLNAHIPLATDHFRHFASVLRAADGCPSELDANPVALIVNERIGVAARMMPWTLPTLMSVSSLAPAFAAGCSVVLTPAVSTPSSILLLMALTGDPTPAGVVPAVNGIGSEPGRSLV